LWTVLDVRVDALENLRRLCLALPEVPELPSHGEPTWFVRGKKTFVTLSDHHHDDRVAFWCAAGPEVRQTLVAQAPEQYFRPPCVGHRGWLGVHLDVPVDWEVVADLVEDAYRVIAPKALVAMLDVRVADPADLPQSSAHGDL
jgi:hypothetical protein